MPLVLTITLPIFVVVLAGFVSAWRRLVDGSGVRGLTGFVFYFALLLTLCHIFANAPVVEEFNRAFLLAYFAVGLAVHLTRLFASSGDRLSNERR